ncbi:DUF4190 domain-containing protein [uncultured Demequina sp.]|uniref:DUF4190 domain-containing protein n=1 Tax=uncultured Demequina sp. TaxID=693499 RepID=UPI0025D31EFD|nr:DUF4190 domain-containing protein [uncultured Demequina sp.]
MTGDKTTEPEGSGTDQEEAPWAAAIGSPSAASAPSTPDADDEPAPDDEATQVLPATEVAADETAPADAEVEEHHEAPATEFDREWMGIAAYASALLALSPLAIILGHLGLSAAKKGRARHRSFALAAVILGWIALIATAVGLWFLLDDTVTPEEIDVQAQQDVSAVGAAAATLAVETNAIPDVAQTEAGYAVGDGELEAHLTTAHELTFTGTAAADWCLDISFEGGTVNAFSYTATGGMAEGACAG